MATGRQGGGREDMRCEGGFASVAAEWPILEIRSSFFKYHWKTNTYSQKSNNSARDHAADIVKQIFTAQTYSEV